MAAAPCKDCRIRPKINGRMRCLVCQLRISPIAEQVDAAVRRLAMVPPELRVARVPASKCPPGTRWCGSCQSFREFADVGKGASQCKACTSAKSHAARTEKVYGLDAAGYSALLKLQGGRCAICRAKPKSKRLAVDHDHKSGEVRGLLCSRCNHDLMGAAWDSLAIGRALVSYLETPPAAGDWIEPGAVRPSKPSEVDYGLSAPGGRSLADAATSPEPGSFPGECHRTHIIPVGSVRQADGVTYRVYQDDKAPAPF